MITHIIYHIDGRKIGCTKNLVYRRSMYIEAEGVEPEIEILEELHDKTDQEAGDIEWQWADRFGYDPGPHYIRTMSAVRERARRGGLIGGSVTSKRGVAGFHNMSFERLQQVASAAGRKAAELGLSGFMVISREKQSEMGRKGGSKRGVCPHCQIESNMANLHRWHFQRCRSRGK